MTMVDIATEIVVTSRLLALLLWSLASHVHTSILLAWYTLSCSFSLCAGSLGQVECYLVYLLRLVQLSTIYMGGRGEVSAVQSSEACLPSMHC